MLSGVYAGVIFLGFTCSQKGTVSVQKEDSLWLVGVGLGFLEVFRHYVERFKGLVCVETWLNELFETESSQETERGSGCFFCSSMINLPSQQRVLST